MLLLCKVVLSFLNSCKFVEFVSSLARPATEGKKTAGLERPAVVEERQDRALRLDLAQIRSGS